MKVPCVSDQYLLGNDRCEPFSPWQVQMFVSVLAMVATTLAAIVHDRKQMEGELNQMNYTLESQVKIKICFMP